MFGSIARVGARSAATSLALKKSASVAPLVISVRLFSTESPIKSPFSNSGDVVNTVTAFGKKLQKASHDQLYHYSHYALAGLTPVALILSPTFLNIPVDLALGVILPYHFHTGLINIVDDYVPNAQRCWAKLVVIAVTVLSTIGLLKMNLCGQGITESLKSFWRAPKQVESKKK